MKKEQNQLGEAEDTEIGEMSFLEHLEEFRWRFLYLLIGVFVGTAVAWIFIDFLVDSVLLIPAKKANISLQNLRPFGQLFLYFQIAIIAGIILSLPNVFYQLWQFIAPALKENEKKYIGWIVLFSTLCFLSGIVFAYFLMIPMTMSFAAQFGTTSIENNFAIGEYFSIIISIMLAAGVVFELPMLSFMLSKMGIITPVFMRKYRRHSIIVILVLAAILTPGTDPVAQLLLAIPLVILYEISIFVSKFSQRKRAEI